MEQKIQRGHSRTEMNSRKIILYKKWNTCVWG